GGGDVTLGLLPCAGGWAAAPGGAPALDRAVRANLRAWAFQTHALSACLDPPEPITCAAWSPDGRLVVTGGEDGTARVWHAASGRAVGSPLRHRGQGRAAAFSPDRKQGPTAGEDGAAPRGHAR